jgi:hypothetical protein
MPWQRLRDGLHLRAVGSGAQRAPRSARDLQVATCHPMLLLGSNRRTTNSADSTNRLDQAKAKFAETWRAWLALDVKHNG